MSPKIDKMRVALSGMLNEGKLSAKMPKAKVKIQLKKKK